jgi:hypothetical protein
VSEEVSMSDRARAVAQQAIPQARQAGTTAVHGFRHGVEGARGWAAPRMHDAADALTASVAPKVSSALHSAATSVEPAAPTKSGIRRLFNWRVLLGISAAVVAAGAGAAIAMRQRYESATMAAKDAAENVADKAGEVAGKVSDKAEETTSKPDVNGRMPHAAHK